MPESLACEHDVIPEIRLPRGGSDFRQERKRREVRSFGYDTIENEVILDKSAELNK